eukprot:219967_1
MGSQFFQLFLLFIVVHLLYASDVCQETDGTCADEVAPTEVIGIDFSLSTDSTIEVIEPGRVETNDISECVNDEWLNQNGTLDGYHVLCIKHDTAQNELNVEYFRGGINDTDTRGQIQISMEDISDIISVRNRLQNALSIIPRPRGYNEWTMYNSQLQKIDTLDVLLKSGTILVYEGGIFIWPPIHIGFSRVLKIKNADASASDTTPFVHYKLKTLSCHPVVILIENFIPHSYCDHIISLSAPHMKDSGVSHMHNTAGSARKWRTSTTHWLSGNDHDKVVNAINQYTADILNIPKPHQELIQVLRYKETQQYDHHWDYFDEKLYRGTSQENTIKGGKNRAVTLYWYLSEVPEGGGGYTFFPQSGQYPRPASLKLVTIDDCHTNNGLVVKPKKGNAIIFYSVKPDGTTDPLSLHGACPVVGKDNVKWGANKWVWTKPFR